MVIFYYATCHNLEPSLTIIIDDGDQYKNHLNPKNFMMPRVKF